MKKAEIGLIGLAVMGANLARNIANKKIPIVVYNRTTEKMHNFIDKYGNEFLSGENEFKNFIKQIQKPRKIIIMVKAGNPVDTVIDQLVPYLDKDDIVIDCGNSNYLDTQKRYKKLQKKGINFIGCGVSGGEDGALNGPSLMPGGNKKSYKKVEPILKKIAAKDFSSNPCITFVGNDGVGHFVKMVHNGIEYAIMQIMAEAYDILRSHYSLEPPKIAKIFKKYNQGKLRSYLFEISVNILNQKDQETNGYLIDHILDKAGQKGTGKWTAISALENDLALPTITEAVFSRIISSHKEKRRHLNKLFPKEKSATSIPLEKFTTILENALYAAMLSIYAQGYYLIEKAAIKENWKIDLSEISRIWQGGCIIRADLLKTLKQAYSNKKNTDHLFEIPSIKKELNTSIPDLQKTVSCFVKNSCPCPGLSSSLNYFQSITQKKLPANFIQALRDYFGAHTYKRTDKKGSFHTQWK